MQSHNQTEREQRFFVLLRPVHTKAERFALSITGSRDDARDLLQDAIVILWQRFDTLRNPAAFKTYLFTVLVNLHRRNHRKHRLEQRFEEGAEEFIDGLAQPADRLTDALIVRQAIDSLPEKSRMAILLYEVHDLPVSEIAAIQQSSVSAVKIRLMRARQKLARMLGVEYDNQTERIQSHSPNEVY